MGKLIEVIAVGAFVGGVITSVLWLVLCLLKPTLDKLR